MLDTLLGFPPPSPPFGKGTSTGRAAPEPFEPYPGRNLKPTLLLLLLPAILISSSCSPREPESEGNSLISREAFIEAYVKLREGALRAPGQEISLQERDRILADLGLVDQDLLDFVEVRGRDIQFMRRVWEEIDSVITVMRENTMPGDRRGT